MAEDKTTPGKFGVWAWLIVSLVVFGVSAGLGILVTTWQSQKLMVAWKRLSKVIGFRSEEPEHQNGKSPSIFSRHSLSQFMACWNLEAGSCL